MQLELDLIWDQARFDLQENNFERLASRFRDDLSDALPRAGAIVQTAARAEAPHRTGRLEESIGMKVNLLDFLVGVGVRSEPPGYGDAGIFARYAVAVGLGSRRHPVHPRRLGDKKALWWEGALHPVRAVTIPERAPDPFLRRGLERSRTAVNAVFYERARLLLEETRI